MHTVSTAGQSCTKETIKEGKDMTSLTAFDEPDFGATSVEVNGVGMSSHSITHHIFVINL